MLSSATNMSTIAVALQNVLKLMIDPGIKQSKQSLLGSFTATSRSSTPKGS